MELGLVTVAIRNASPAPSLRFYGTGRIAGDAPGLVTVGGIPAARRIHLHDAITHLRVARTISRGDGSWSFENLDASRLYYVIAFDHEGRFNAVIRDRVQPV